MKRLQIISIIILALFFGFFIGLSIKQKAITFSLSQGDPLCDRWRMSRIINSHKDEVWGIEEYSCSPGWRLRTVFGNSTGLIFYPVDFEPLVK